MRKSETPVAAANAVQYIWRSKFFGLPFHAAYPIAAAIDGTTMKKVKMSNPASIHRPVSECIMLESISKDIPGIKVGRVPINEVTGHVSDYPTNQALAALLR